MANNNHKTFVQKTKCPIAQQEGRRGHTHHHCLKGKNKRGKCLDDIVMILSWCHQERFFWGRCNEKLFGKNVVKAIFAGNAILTHQAILF